MARRVSSPGAGLLASPGKNQWPGPHYDFAVQPNSTYVGRFAPSPTGKLHFGSLLVAVGSWLRARAQNGAWLVRIEDLDVERSVPGAAERIVETLASHGLRSTSAIVSQRDDTSRYAAAVKGLEQRGLVYPCWCSRAVVAAAGGIHRACHASAPTARRGDPCWRFRTPPGIVRYVDALKGERAHDVAMEFGDFVLKRANGEYTYQLSVVVDDAWQGVTEVVRGSDLLDSTARQVALQRALGLPTPGYLHLPVVVDESGAKLSKQARSCPVDPDEPMTSLRAVLSTLGQSLDESARRPDQLLEAAARRFDVAALPRALELPCPRY